MSKAEKIIVSIIVIIITILITTVVCAYDDEAFVAALKNLKIDESIYINADVDYRQPQSRFFCVQKDQHMVNGNFTLVDRIKLTGLDATSLDSSKTVSSKYNAQLAYILSAPSIMKEDGETKKYHYYNMRYAIWEFLGTWHTAVGKKLSNVELEKFTIEVDAAKGNDGGLISEANDYADKLVKNFNETGGQYVKDNTDMEKLSITKSAEYIKIGPFNWTFIGKLSQIQVYDQDNTLVNKVVLKKYTGSEEVEIRVSQIVSGETNFSIWIPASSGITAVKRIVAKGKGDIKGGYVYFLNAGTGGTTSQNVIARYGITTTKEYQITVEKNIPLSGNLKVIKLDDFNREIKLENVGFTFKNTTIGKYLREEKGKITYVDNESQATEFKTDENGEILLEGIVEGTYIAKEINNPNGYEILNRESQKVVEINKTATLTIYNPRSKGNLKIVKIDKDNNDVKLEGVKFIIQCKETGKYVKRDNNRNITYVDKSQATEFITDSNGEFTIDGLAISTYVAYETDITNNYGYEVTTEGFEKYVSTGTTTLTITNELCKGNLKIIKVNKHKHEVKLAGVGFVFQNVETGKYITYNSNGTVRYVNTREEAQEFTTDENGEILLEGVVIGTYVAYETKNLNYGYEFITEGINLEQKVVKDQTTEVIVENTQIYVKLSGYVWLDKQSGKQSTRNNLYRQDLNDDSDQLLEGVTVRLMDKTTGSVVDTATTKQIVQDDKIIRYYQFVNVEIEKIENYYIEFEYDGLTYTNVVPHIDVNNGSKAAENANTRDQFNKGFSSIEGRTETTGVALDQSGNVAHNLTYTRDTANHTSTLVNTGLPAGQYPITANTDEAGYKFNKDSSYGKEEIPYINLGLYLREQPDLAVVKDMQNVRLAINGYQHVYEYAQRFANQGEYSGTGFNVGVKFGSEYTSQTYTRAIYKADYEYTNPNDSSKELKVYVTYKIAIRNEATNLVSRANSIVDYYDSRYTLVGVGTGANQDGTLSGSINYTQQSYNDKFSKIIINTNMTLDPQSQGEIYVQFELNREAVLNIMNDGENLDNVAEINSYSTFDKNGNTYAGIDVDSNPGNATPGNLDTYEDDTDRSPALKLEVADNARIMVGKVFLDSTRAEMITGEIRQGSGAYEDGEQGIEGVQVTLTENTGSGKIYTATTNANGDFEISGYIPGDYTLTYTWGNETYTVQNYKGTVYNKDRYNANIANKEWYKNEATVRLTDAIDDYATRQAIDAELTEITNSTQTTIQQMNSTTPTMGIGVEYDTTTTASSGDRYEYIIQYMDFGIVERARQDLNLNKRIAEMKVTLANGMTLVDFTIAEDGTLTGERASVTYLPPSSSMPKNGLVRLEMDSELIQGATVQVRYEIKAQNISELEYLTEDYYKYGIIPSGTNPVTITPSAIVDYLDTDWSFTPTNNTGWEVVSKDDTRLDLAQTVKDSTSIDNRTILYTEALARPLVPGESTSISLTVSKLLTAQDIELDNEAEVVKVEKPGGPGIVSTPGNYIPGTGPNVESDDDMAETVIITPNTGEDRNYVIPAIIVITAFTIIVAGVVVIKKTVLSK